MTIEPELLRRIDAVCEARGEPRSAYIARALRSSIAEEEKFLREMESPVWRALYATLANSPGILSAVASLVNEELTDEMRAEIKEGLAEQGKRGRERVKGRKGNSLAPKTA